MATWGTPTLPPCIEAFCSEEFCSEAKSVFLFRQSHSRTAGKALGLFFILGFRLQEQQCSTKSGTVPRWRVETVRGVEPAGTWRAHSLGVRLDPLRRAESTGMLKPEVCLPHPPLSRPLELEAPSSPLDAHPAAPSSAFQGGRHM